MIDLHFHCLPGIDDGAADWDEAVALCRLAAAQGTETIVATPHVLRDPWLNEDRGARDSLLAELNRRLGGTPEVLPGAEVWYSSDLVELVEKGDAGPLVGLNGSMCLLVETSPLHPVAAVEAAFHELLVMGRVPILAHPERNPVFWREPDRLRRWAERGVLLQITAGSILGDFGRQAMEFSEWMLDASLVHLVASDAHNLVARPPRLAEAREKLRERPGLDEKLFGEGMRELIGLGAREAGESPDRDATVPGSGD